MTPSNLKHFRRLLTNRLVALFKSARQDLRASAVERALHGDEVDPGDEVDDSERVELADLRKLLDERQGAQALALEEALRRIARGEYGACVDCAGEIERARLELVPWALRCAADEQALEHERAPHPPTL